MASSCLLMAGDNYHQCDPQVENYKTCKRFWVIISSEIDQLIRFLSRPLYERLLRHIIY